MAILPTGKQIEQLETLPRNEVAFAALLSVIDTEIQRERDLATRAAHASVYRHSVNDRQAEIEAITRDGRRLALEDIRKMLGTLTVKGQ